MNRDLASGPVVWVGIILTTCLLLVLFQTMLWLVMPVLLAVVAYYLLSPLVTFAMSRRMSRGRAVLIVTVVLSAILFGLGFFLAPKINSTVHTLPKQINDYGQVATRLVDNFKQSLYNYLPFLKPRRVAPSFGANGSNSAAPLVSKLSPAATPASGPGTASTINTTSDDVANEVADLQAKYSGDIAIQLAHWIPSIFLVPFITYYFLLEGPRFKRFLVRAIPNAFFEKTLYLFYRVDDQLRRYFQGLLALTALDALCLGTGLYFFGLSAPFFLAALAAVMAWLPYLGSIAGGLLVVLVAGKEFPESNWLPYEVVGLFIAVRLLDDFVFMPMTVGRSLHMHPLLTVLMIMLAGAVAGISGLLLVMPVMGVVMVAGQIIGELATDERILARHRHARRLKRQRARADLYDE